jgi:predicted alpha/beta-hydrolase family hydrolase
MRHPFLESVAQLLAERGVGTLRYEFPYMEKKSRRPDPPPVATARVREAALEAARLAPGLPLIAGGKSFGGRMTSTAQAEAPLPGVRGLAFLGFPLHPPGKPSTARADHLARVAIPMLFLQGTRDEFATLALLEPTVAALGPRATLGLLEGGDHSFKVPKASGSPAAVLAGICDTLARWSRTVVRGY